MFKLTEIIRKKHSFKGSDNFNWRGGKILRKGYWYIYAPDHPFATKAGYVAEHRLVMEEYLDRYLTKKEEVHHLDLNKENNRIGNIILFASRMEHQNYERAGIKKVNTSNRYCLLCSNNKTYIKKRGWEQWCKYQDGFICMKCYLLYYRKRKLPLFFVG